MIVESLRVPSGRPLSEVNWKEFLSKYTPPQSEFDKIILEHFIVEGFSEAVDCFCQEARLPPPPSLYNIKERFEIRRAIEAGDINTATSLLNDLNPDLLEVNRRVHFTMILQKLIELFRTDQLEEGLAFGQDVVAPVVEENPQLLAPQLEQVMTLLLFPQNNGKVINHVPAEINFLYSQEHRLQTAQIVNDAILEYLSNDSPIESKIPNLLKLFDWCQQALGPAQPSGTFKILFCRIRH